MSLTLPSGYSGLLGGVLGSTMSSFQSSISELQPIQLSRLDLAIRLKLIGTIREGEKLDTRTLTIQQMGIVTSLQRRASGCNRSHTKTFVWETLTAASRVSREMLRKVAHTDDISEAKTMMIDLENALTGISSLQQTYSTDRPFCCSLDTLRDEIKRDVDGYKTKIREQETRFPSITDGRYETD